MGVQEVAGQLECLAQIQALDTQIYGLRELAAAQPQALAECRQAYDAAQTAWKVEQERARGLQIKHKQKELDLSAKEAGVKKHETDLYKVKTNREYSALQHEIEALKADNSLLEEEILKLLDEIETVTQAVEAHKTRVDEALAVVTVKETQTQQAIASVEKQLEQLEAKRNALTSQIEPLTLSRYERILANRGGLALVPLMGEACAGCHLVLPPQVINEARLKREIVTCGSCARILYSPDQHEGQEPDRLG